MSSRLRPLSIVALLLAGAAALVVVVAGSPPADAGRNVGRAVIATCGARPATGHGVAAEPGTFYRLEPRLDAAGSLIGQRLTVGRDAVPAGVADLGAESGASGPTEGIVTMVDDDGASSRVALVSAAGRCATTVYTTPGVVRRAILDPADGSILVHQLDRSSRSDLGVWRVVEGQATRVLEPLPASLGLGRIWATDLRLDAAGRRLAVQSCLDVECLARIVDLDASGAAPIVVRGAAQGSMLGLGAGQLVTWSACDGTPCDLLAWDLGGSTPRVLARDALAASLTGDARLLLATLTADGAASTVAIDPASGTIVEVHGLLAGERPLSNGGAATQGLEVDAAGVGIATPGGATRIVHLSLTGEVLP